MKIVKTLAVLSLVLPAIAFSQANTPLVDQRQANQERRIDQGVASGSLTQREANRLDRGQDRVDNMENRAKSDGVVTRGERVFTAKNMIVSTITTIMAASIVAAEHASPRKNPPVGGFFHCCGRPEKMARIEPASGTQVPAVPALKS